MNEGRADWIQSFQIPDGARIIDIGCGNGYLDICLARRGYEVVGVDRLVAVLDEARERPDGEYRWTWTSDPETRLNYMVPEFETPDGTIYEMRDPYEPERGDHMGLIRYIYPKDELMAMLDRAGFTVTDVPHYLSYVLPDVEDNSYALMCSSRSY